MATITPIVGGLLESGLSARNKINYLIDFYNKIAISNGSYVLDRVSPAYIKDAAPSGKFLRDDGTYQIAITSPQSLQDVVTVSNIVSGAFAVSPDNASKFYTNGAGIGTLMQYDDGSNNGQIRIRHSSNLIDHTVAIDLTAPLINVNGNISMAANKTIIGGTGLIDFYTSTGVALTSDNGSYVTPYVWTDNNGVNAFAGIFHDGLNSKLIQVINANEVDVLTIVGFGGMRVFNNKTLISNSVVNEFKAPSNLFSDGGIYFVSGIGIDTTTTVGSDVLNIGATNANVINYGNSTTVHNFLGTAIYELQVNSYVTDKLITLNYGGSVASGIGVGFEIEEAGVINAYLKTNSARTGFSFKSQDTSYSADIIFTGFTANRSYTLPDVNGAIALAADVALKVDKTNSVLLSYLEVPEQSTPSTPTNAIRFFADSSNRFAWIGENGYTRTFDGTANTANRIYTLPDAAGTVVLNTNTQTLTNKRLTIRVSTIASSATPTPNADTDDEYTITALAVASLLTNPTGTPTEGQSLLVRYKDNGTARALTFDTAYRFSTDLIAPTTTVINKTLYMAFIWNSADSKWDCIGWLNNF